MKNTMRKAMLSTIAMLVVAVMSLTGVTYAWFTAGEAAAVTGMSMEVTTADGGIEVREKGGDGIWKTTLELADAKLSSVKPVSSSNGVNFFTAAINPENAAQIATTAVDTNGVAANVITRTLELRNTGVATVQVNLNGSEVVDKANASSGFDTDIYKAARVAIIVGQTTYIWSSDATDASYFGVKAASGGVFFNAYEANASYTDTKVLTSIDDCKISLPGLVDGEAQTVEVKVVAWLEGQDTDCVNNNAGGAFDIKLNFKKVAPAQD